MGDAPIAIAWKLKDDLLNLIVKTSLFVILILLIIVLILLSAIDRKQLTEPVEHKVRMGLMGLRNHGMTLRDAMLCNASG